MSSRPIDAIAHHMPGAVGRERNFRLRMYRAQAIAIARATHEKNGRARTLYYEASALATAWLFRRADLDDLERILRALNQIFIAADNIVQAERFDGE